MPNQPKPDRRKVTYFLPVDVAVRLRKYAIAHKTTVQSVVETLIYQEVKDVSLTYEEVLAIAEEIRKNEAKRHR